jgi:hypothetical protein
VVMRSQCRCGCPESVVASSSCWHHYQHVLQWQWGLDEGGPCEKDTTRALCRGQHTVVSHEMMNYIKKISGTYGKNNEAKDPYPYRQSIRTALRFAKPRTEYYGDLT